MGGHFLVFSCTWRLTLINEDGATGSLFFYYFQGQVEKIIPFSCGIRARSFSVNLLIFIINERKFASCIDSPFKARLYIKR